MFLLYRINNQQWKKLAPSFLNTSHCEFYGAHLCDHARRTILSHLICPFLKIIYIPSFNEESVTRSSSKSVQPVFCYSLIKSSFIKKIFMQQSFFLLSFFLSSFIFIIYFMRACMNPGFLFSDFQSLATSNLVVQ